MSISLTTESCSPSAVHPKLLIGRKTGLSSIQSILRETPIFSHLIFAMTRHSLVSLCPGFSTPTFIASIHRSTQHLYLNYNFIYCAVCLCLQLNLALQSQILVTSLGSLLASEHTHSPSASPPLKSAPVDCRRQSSSLTDRLTRLPLASQQCSVAQLEQKGTSTMTSQLPVTPQREGRPSQGNQA